MSRTPVEQRVYFTHADLERHYGAADDDLDQVEQYGRRHHLVVKKRSKLARSITLRGRFKDVMSAFPADVQHYECPAGAYRGRQGQVSLPAQLIGIVTGVFGLDTRPKNRSPFRLVTLSQPGEAAPGGLSAVDFANRYNFPTEAGGVSLDGRGQTIAVVELGGGYQTDDLAAFFDRIGARPPTVAWASVDHARNSPTVNSSADGEVMLDIEVVGAVVPSASLVVYFGPNEGDKGLLETIAAAVYDRRRKPSVIAMSWGASEALNDQAAMNAYHELFVAAGALGVTVCAAAGDHGTANETAESWDGDFHVSHPASDPLVLACGGTQIQNGVETVWNDGRPLTTPGGAGGWAGGGGVSAVFGLPDYQKDAHVPPSLKTGKIGRGVPDLAMSATNYFVRINAAEGISGGTSAVAPLMAGLIARLNQAKGRRVGFFNPILYETSARSAFRDVLKGTNAIERTLRGYTAGPGWNACTGLGTPDGMALLNHLG